jgi:cellulose synthase/poly-beta-1,6-N-acetylglucosamine synthase-like glycosyltransferase
MSETALVLFWILVGSMAAQALLVFGFVAALRRFRPGPATDFRPKAAVVLCLRGTDPFLPDCIRALLNQNYPNFDLHVVVDCIDDPAWSVVEDVVECQHARNVRVRPLEYRRDTCSLKCSSVVQAISELDDSYEVVALVDADTLAHPNWLAELVAPLADPGVGAATGNRWYMPHEISWGSLVRYLWNAAAIVQMYWYGIAWGGTLVLRLKTLRETDLLERWSHSFCEDTMLYGVLRRFGLRVVFVPSLMMVNREGCDIPGYFNWVGRQLLTARLYHPAWLAVAFHGISTSLLLIAVSVMLIASLAAAQYDALRMTVAGLLIYQGSMLFLIALLEAAVRPIVRARGEPVRWLSLSAVLRFVPALFLTQAVYSAAVLLVLRVRNVVWRGVSYRICGPWQIHLEQYQPYAAPQAQPDPLASL